MASLDFPVSPTANQIFSALSGVIYRWQATPGMWLAVGQSSAGGDFSATYATPLGGVTSTSTKLVFDLVQTGNSGGWYSAGRYTPPAGRYRICAETYGTLSSAATSFTLTLLKNGATNDGQSVYSTAGANFYGSGTVDMIVNANGTDYWEVWLAASASSSSVQGRFSAFPISGIQGPPGDPGTPLAQNAQTGSYTLVLGDANGHLYHAVAAAAATYTIPANTSVAYPIGTTLSFVNDSTNNVTIAITTDTLVLSPGTTTGSRTLATGGVATALKVTSTRWIINGTGLT